MRFVHQFVHHFLKLKGWNDMATVQKNISKKTGKVINYKWTAVLGRDENNKQVRLTKRVEPYGLTDKAEMKRMKHDADDWEAEKRAEYEKLKDRENTDKAKAWKEKDKITLEDFINNRWITKHVEHGAREHTPDTIAFYKSMSKDIIEYFNSKEQGIKLSQIDLEDVLDYLSWMRNDAKTKRGTPYGATTIQHHYSTLRNIFEYAVYTKYVKSNPCKEVSKNDRPQREDIDIDFLDEDEAIRFISALDSEEEKNYWRYRGLSKADLADGKENDSWKYDYLFWKSMVNIFITTGLRRGELIGLQWGDVDRDNLIFTVQRNVTQDTSNKDSNDPEMKIHIGQIKAKGKKEKREVPFLNYILPMLDELKAEQEKRFGVTLLPTAYIFSSNADAFVPRYPTEPTRLMQKYIKRHKLPSMSPHDLRHTAGYLAKAGGADVKDIQAMYGHKDAGVSMKHYIAFTRKTQRKTADGIEKVLFAKAEEETKQA